MGRDGGEVLRARCVGHRGPIARRRVRGLHRGSPVDTQGRRGDHVRRAHRARPAHGVAPTGSHGWGAAADERLG